jgi:hypothetical protein
MLKARVISFFERFPFLLCFGLPTFAFGLDSALAQSPVVLTIDAKARGAAIPKDFIGLSFETSNLLPDTNGNYLFSAEDEPLINWFRALGIKSLRVGGNTVDLPRYRVPARADMDHLFAFAKAADLKVIYTLRLLNGNPKNAATAAKYIQEHYQPQLACFAIGNEPDWPSYHDKDPKITGYPSFLGRWREFAAAITSAVPSAKIAGPDTGSDYPVPGASDTTYAGKSWTEHFADDERRSGIAAIFQHDYVGQSAEGVSVPTAIDAMLSRAWLADYQTLYRHVLHRVLRDGLPFRMTECNDYTGGVDGASNAFASALWALDYMHWWAAHGCAGVNFHNKKWIYTDTIYRDAEGKFQINPKAYALKAFELGGCGHVIAAIRLFNPKKLNVDCYAVGAGTNLYVTIINKTHGSSDGVDAIVTIKPKHLAAAGGEYIVLASVPAGDGLAKNVTLGGETIANNVPWQGVWTPLSVSRTGQCKLTVKAASAAVVHIF